MRLSPAGSKVVPRRRTSGRGSRRVLAGAAVLAVASTFAVSAGTASALPVASLSPLVAAKPLAAGTIGNMLAPLRVASYNVRCSNCFDGDKNEKRWADRRGAVVANILAQDLDVVGVQEASQGLLHDSETGSRQISQFDDLAERLGGPWRVTNATRYNCAKDTSPNNCSYVYKGASDSNRIFYNSARVQLVAQGSTKLSSPSGKGDNYMAWAELKQLTTGKRFMFSDLHTVSEDKYHAYKAKQAAQAAASLKAHNPGKLPMIAVGDFNSSRFEKPSNGPYDAYVKAGFVDPLGGAYKTSHTAPHATVQKRIHTWLSSSNRWERTAPAHKDWINGSYIDYIFTTKMRVSEWETVAHIDSRGRFVGTIPSDHNLIRATVWLP